MNYKLLALIGLVIVLISGCTDDGGADYEIIGDSVMIDDSFIYMNVTPHTAKHSQWIELEFESKVFTGEIDFVFGFNTTDGVYPKKAQRWTNNPKVISNETIYYTCTEDFNYTIDPNHFWCFESWTNGTSNNLIFDHDFDGGNLGSKTAWWQEVTYSNWVDWSPDNSKDYDYLGMDKWYYSKNQTVTAGKVYKIRYYLEVPYNTKDGKYNLAIKPTSETISEAIENEHFWVLDPWYSYDMWDGLLAYYTFDNDDYSSTTLRDMTDQGRNATNTGAATGESGILEESFKFETTDVLSTASDTDLQLLSGGAVNMWVDFSVVASGSRLFSKDIGGGGAGNDGYTIWFDADGGGDILQLYIDGASAAISTNDVNTSGWQMVTALIEETPSISSIFIDGVNATASGTARTMVGGATDLDIGNRIGDDRPFNDVIDEFGIWNRTLTSSEITALYNSGVGLPYPSLKTIAAIDNFTITPSTAGPESVLTCTAIVSNLNGENMGGYMAWYKNGTIQESYNYTFSGVSNGTKLTSNQIEETSLIGDIWKCEVYAELNATEWTRTTKEVGIGNLSESLLAYYSFDDDSPLGDLTAQGRNLTIVGVPVRNLGKYKEAYFFDTDDDKLHMNSQTMTFDKRISVAFWFNATVGAQVAYLTGSDGGPFNMYCQTDGDYKTYVGGTTIVATEPNCGAPGYNFVAATYDGNAGADNLRMYVSDGTDIYNYSVAETDAISAFVDNLFIGDHLAADDNSGANGIIDEYAIWNKTLTYAEILTLFNEGEGINYSGIAIGESLDVSDKVKITPHNITPDPAYQNASLTCSAYIFNNDANDMNGSLTWYKNDAIQETYNYTFDSEVSGTWIYGNPVIEQLVHGDVWNCSVFGFYDDDITSNGTNGEAITISDTPPYWVYNPNNLTINHTTDVTLQYTCIDVDATPTYSIVNATTDLVTQLTINSTGYVFGNPVSADTGNHTYNVTCDEYTNNITQILNVTILNNAPTIPTTLTDDNYTTAGVNATITCDGSTDIDGDTLNYSFFNSSDDLLQNSLATTHIFENLLVGNNPWYCLANDGTSNSSITTSRNVTYINLSVCGGPNSYFINFTFVDEETAGTVNGSQNIVIDNWYSSAYTSNVFDYDYLNATEAPNSGICVYPDDIEIVTPIKFIYGGADYETRTFESDFTLTNTTTTQILYQLASSTGGNYVFYTVDAGLNPIKTVDIIVKRDIGGVSTLILTGTTDDSGAVTFWLLPDITHTLTFTKSGYPTTEISIVPGATAERTVVMGEGSAEEIESDYFDTAEGLKWNITPSQNILTFGTSYDFKINLTDSKEGLVDCYMILENSTDYVYEEWGCAATPEGDILQSLNRNMTHKQLTGHFYYKTNLSTPNIVLTTRYWVTLNQSGTSAGTIKSFFEQSQLLFSIDGTNEEKASGIIWFFLFLTIGVGIISFVSGLDLRNPFAIMVFVTVPITFGCAVNLLPLVSVGDNVFSQFGLAMIAWMINAGHWLRALGRGGI